jgi:hypothetical protein
VIRSYVRAPSIKRLTSDLKDVDIAKAKLIRRIIKGDIDELLIVDSELSKTYDIHNSRLTLIHHTTGEIRDKLLDTVLGTFGVEYVFRTSEGLQTSMSMPDDRIIGKYLNAGDTYAPTLIRQKGSWRIGTMADLCE